LLKVVLVNRYSVDEMAILEVPYPPLRGTPQLAAAARRIARFLAGYRHGLHRFGHRVFQFGGDPAPAPIQVTLIDA
jgi:hypothetical protein